MQAVMCVLCLAVLLAGPGGEPLQLSLDGKGFVGPTGMPVRTENGSRLRYDKPSCAVPYLYLMCVACSALHGACACSDSKTHKNVCCRDTRSRTAVNVRHTCLFSKSYADYLSGV
jgi:hypothetical protein